jgi:hypothetical protein
MYQFETNNFGLNSEAIHLLRNRFNYKSIPLKDIDKLSIKKGPDINNWLIALLVGLSLISFALYETVTLIEMFYSEDVHVIYVQRIILPFLPALIGIYLLVLSLRRTTILQIMYGSEKHQFSLMEIIKKDSLENFISHLKLVVPEYKIHLEV